MKKIIILAIVVIALGAACSRSIYVPEYKEQYTINDSLYGVADSTIQRYMECSKNQTEEVCDSCWDAIMLGRVSYEKWNAFLECSKNEGDLGCDSCFFLVYGRWIDGCEVAPDRKRQ